MKRVFLPSLFPASILLQSYANLIFSHHLHTQSISKSSYLTPNTPQTIPVLFYRNKPMFEPPRFPPKLLSLIISIGELIYPIWKLAGFKNEVSDSFVDHDGYSISSKGVLPALRGTLGSSLRSTAEGEGNEGFPPPPDKDLESPSSTRKISRSGLMYTYYYV